LKEDLVSLLKRLENSPVLPLPGPVNNATKIRISAQLFAEAFRFFLYSPESASRAPKLLSELLNNQPGLVENALGTRRLASGERLAGGFFLSVSCTEDVPYLPKNLIPLVAGTFGGDYRLKQQIQACTEWPRGEVSEQHRLPTKSSIPTLILSGELDPVTPASGGDEVMRGLTQGLHVAIRNNGHPIGSADKCIAAIIQEFIEKGSEVGIDRSCADTIPTVPFLLPNR
jgi:pimeloyl-ACP methyl ester carboxylesterase